MLFLGSPFPWSPGHMVMETEYLIQKRIITNDNRPYTFPIFSGPVSGCLKMVYGEYLDKTYGINLITDTKEIKEAINDTRKKDIRNISLSHSQFVKDTRVKEKEYKRIENPNSSYTSLGCECVVEYSGSTNLVNSITNEFSWNQYKVLNNRQLMPGIDTGITHRTIPQSAEGKKIVLINIREHIANGNGATTLDDYIPLISYCNSKGYCIIDVSHDKKSFTNRLEELGVIAYWKIENKNFINDIDLFSKASFYVGTGGPTHLALALRIPTIWVAGLTPLPLPTQFGYQIPISLHKKSDLQRLSTAEGTGELINLRNG